MKTQAMQAVLKHATAVLTGLTVALVLTAALGALGLPTTWAALLAWLIGGAAISMMLDQMVAALVTALVTALLAGLAAGLALASLPDDVARPPALVPMLAGAMIACAAGAFIAGVVRDQIARPRGDRTPRPPRERA